ncbi:MAG: hypothetical protein ACRDSH_10870, partial [Pseudonocardiaceae bacterium]
AVLRRHDSPHVELGARTAFAVRGPADQQASCLDTSAKDSARRRRSAAAFSPLMGCAGTP